MQDDKNSIKTSARVGYAPPVWKPDVTDRYYTLYWSSKRFPWFQHIFTPNVKGF